MKVKFEVMEAASISGVLDKEGKSARLNGSFKNRKVETVVDVHCLPLFTLLAALDFPTVDFFSLDVEGAELGILQTIPWDQVHNRKQNSYISVSRFNFNTNVSPKFNVSETPIFQESILHIKAQRPRGKMNINSDQKRDQNCQEGIYI